MKKDLCLLPRIQEALESLPGPEIPILADQDGSIVEAIHGIYYWQLGLL